MARWERHPLRRKAVWIGIVDSVKNVSLIAGVSEAGLDPWIAIAGALIGAAAELGVLIKTGEADVTPVSDPSLPDGHWIPGDDLAGSVEDA